MRWLSLICVTALVACSVDRSHADYPSAELQWSSVHLEGMHLHRVFPGAGGSYVDLYFAKGGMLPTTRCSNNMCTDPLIVWKIENNRLKMGYAPTEGDALIQVTPDKLVVREPNGELATYSIVPKSGT